MLYMVGKRLSWVRIVAVWLEPGRLDAIIGAAIPIVPQFLLRWILIAPEFLLR